MDSTASADMPAAQERLSSRKSRGEIKRRLAYRPDIDALRAIAVLPVVLFHYQIAGFSGGFVGVDVFFVISGYLITALVHKDLQEGRFTLIGFYERRVRRILPALFAMLAGTWIIAAFILFPADLKAFATNTLAVTLFSANLVFWHLTNYFNNASGQNSLLHTWSLAVEEQFYIVFPAIFALLYKHLTPRRVRAAIGALALISLGFCIYMDFVRQHEVGAFYLPMARGWELMFGALLAIGAVPVLSKGWQRDGIALLGLAMIVWAVTSFGPTSPLLLINVLVPCLGAAFIIWAGEGGGCAVSRALAQRQLVFIGLVSYSLYLWHWPLWAFVNYWLDEAPSWPQKVALIGASFVLAVLSWRYVERPFRVDRTTFHRHRLFRIAGLTMAASIALGILIIETGGLPGRYPPAVLRILAARADFPVHSPCFDRTAPQAAAGQFCKFGDAQATPSIALWGDSHALALLATMDQLARRHGEQGLFISRSDCPAFPVGVAGSPLSPTCKAYNREAMRFLANQRIRTVIMVARWAFYDKGALPGEDAMWNRETRVTTAAAVTSDQHTVFSVLVDQAVRQFQARGMRIVFVMDVPEIGRQVPQLLARDAMLGHPVEGPSIDDYRARQRGVTEVIAPLERAGLVQVVQPAELLCAAGRCLLVKDGRSLYWDGDHLTGFGASQLAPLLDRAM